MIALQQRGDEHNTSQNTSYKLAFSYGIVELNPTAPHSLEALLAEGNSTITRLKNLQAGLIYGKEAGRNRRYPATPVADSPAVFPLQW